MAWIKRNLFFLIGSVLALVLMGLAGWYFYSQWNANKDLLDKLNAKYAELDRLNKLPINPGEKGAGKVDNVKAAQDQQQELRQFISKTRAYFQRIPPIPDLPKVGDSDFSTAETVTIAQMQHAASNASVTLSDTNYSFSFEAERHRIAFSSGSLAPLAVQLGEVKAITDVLIEAKVNALDSVRRERVSADDANGPATDYIEQRSTTNELAVLTPYEVVFRGFSPEVAAVLAGYASSPYGIIVKSVNVESSPATAPVEPPPTAVAQVPQPVYIPPPRPVMPEDRYSERRYGPRGQTPFAPPRPQPYIAQVAAPSPSANKGGLPTVIDEKQLKVTMVLNIVKLVVPNSK
ncbi:conserved exported hypothetical protein [Verrucomicrobia bacterium]|nr:conserved exported hypothetical protein [Verrucomicrobiota bacterium]